MAQLQLDVTLGKIAGNEERIFDTSWRTPTYETAFETTLSIGTTLTEIRHHLSAIKFVYIRVVTDDRTLEVHKNWSPEYWSVDSVFFATDTDFENLSLQADQAASVYIYLGGDA